jgi:hypothetical protein
MRRAVVLASLALVSCGGGSSVSPAVEAARERLAAVPIICTSDAECDALWARAVIWVAGQSHYPVLVQSDILLQTSGPQQNYSYPAYRLTRSPQPDGTQRIELTSWCDNIFGCNPTQTTARAELVAHLGVR